MAAIPAAMDNGAKSQELYPPYAIKPQARMADTKLRIWALLTCLQAIPEAAAPARNRADRYMRFLDVLDEVGTAENL